MVLANLERCGGTRAASERAACHARMVYDEIDGSGGLEVGDTAYPKKMGQKDFSSRYVARSL